MVLFIGVNKNGSASLHTISPVRNEERGEWVSLRPYINSTIQKSINDMIRHSDMNWTMEPEFMDISLKQINTIYEEDD